jgi:aldehyde dehydrogenase (NAD+)
MKNNSKILARSSAGKKTAAKPKAKVTVKNATPVHTKARKGLSFNYDPAPESASVVKIEKQYELFINGEFQAPKKGLYFDTLNPGTGEKLSKIAEGTKEDVDLAVKSARKAYQDIWSKMPAKERGKYLFRIARLMQERARELAVLETLDGGKPIKESRDIDIPLAAQHFFYYAGWADKLDYALPGRNYKSLGVCGQIIPWNFPLLMAAWKIAPALACGNTVVLKPAETTPLTALLLAEIFQEADLPPGVVNVITGAGATGALLVDHPDVNKIAFTGSTDIGKRIAAAVAGSGKKLTLELGGKSANIVFEDAALDQAVEGIINGIYFNQGHVCCAGSRLLVEESIHPVLVKKLQKRMESLRVGDPMDKNTDIGAINSKEQLSKIEDLVAKGKQEGLKYWQPSCALPSKGNYHRPAFFDHVAPSSIISRTEIFGPVLAISTFRTPDEAIIKANDTPYGLAAGIWSEKGSKIHQVAAGLRAGVIWANTYNKFDAASPFGGFKESGFGREGGLQGLLPYLEIKK